MKAPRSQKRRDFNVASAGFFSVLKMAPRTVTVRPPAGYRSLVTSSTTPETPEQIADRLGTTKISLIGEPGMMDRGLTRMALIVFGAGSFTFLILWWIMGARH
jgi:hypothetical protein